MSGSLIIGITLAYLGLLFGIAYYANRLTKRGRKWVSNAYIYSLSLAVYCTAWTFFGSVGRASTQGLSFLPIYLGPDNRCTNLDSRLAQGHSNQQKPAPYFSI